MDPTTIRSRAAAGGHTTDHPRRAAAGLTLAVALTIGATACGGTAARQTAAPAGTAVPGGVTAPAAAPVTGAQDLTVNVVDGRIPVAIFGVQPGPVRLNVVARGGPYLLKIEPLLPAKQIARDATTTITFTATTPGDYTMVLSPDGQTGAAATESAVFKVLPPGSASPAATPATAANQAAR